MTNMHDDSTQADPREILRALELLCAPGEVHELRALKTPWRTVSGFYDDLLKMASDAARLSNLEAVPAVYFTPNPVSQTGLTFQHGDNYSLKYASKTTADEMIVRRKWLPIDVDPVREAGTSSTDDEHNRALSLARQVAEWLSNEMGWPAPMLADSGNGAHLNYRVDLPNDDASLRMVIQILRALKHRFGDEHVLVDQTVSNAARIWKVYGTMTRKGAALDSARPHRFAKLCEVPDTLSAVTLDQLSTVAALAPPEPPITKGQSGRKGKRFDIEGWLDEHGVAVKRAKMLNDGRMRYILESCPFYPEHSGTSVAIFQTIGGPDDGKLGFKCHHDHCVDNHWEELRERLDPSVDGLAQLLGLGK